MTLSTRRRGTYANAVSTLALVIAVMGGGTALAAGLAKDSVTSRHIKDGSVTGDDVDEATLGTVPASRSAKTAKTADWAQRAGIADVADVAEEARRAGEAQTAGRLLGFMRASVSATGEFNQTRSVGVVSSEETSTPGRYVVTFDGPLLGCFLMAGVAHNETAPVAGTASAWITPNGDLPSFNKVTVETHAPGAADSTPDPAPFSLVVFCGGHP